MSPEVNENDEHNCYKNMIIIEEYMKSIFLTIAKIGGFERAVKRILKESDTHSYAGSIMSASLINLHPIGRSYMNSTYDYFPKVSPRMMIFIFRPNHEWSALRTQTNNKTIGKGVLMIPVWVHDILLEIRSKEKTDDITDISTLTLQVGQPFAFDTNLQYRFVHSKNKTDEQPESNIAIFICYETLILQRLETIRQLETKNISCTSMERGVQNNLSPSIVIDTFYKLMVESLSCRTCISLGSSIGYSERLIERDFDLPQLNVLFEKTQKVSSDSFILTLKYDTKKWRIDEHDENELETSYAFDESDMSENKYDESESIPFPPSKELIDDQERKACNEYIYLLPVAVRSNDVYFEMMDEEYETVTRQKVCIGNLLFYKVGAIHRFIGGENMNLLIFIKWVGATPGPSLCSCSTIILDASEKRRGKLMKGWNLLNNQRRNITLITDVQFCKLKSDFVTNKFIRINNFFKSDFANQIHKSLSTLQQSEWMACFVPDLPNENNDDVKMKSYRYIPENFEKIKNHREYVGNVNLKQKFAYSFKRIDLQSLNHKDKCNCSVCNVITWCGTKEFLSLITKIVGKECTRLESVFCSWYDKDDFLSPHTDTPNGNIAFIIQLSKNWEKDRGGCLELYRDNNLSEIQDVVIPLFNTLTLFEIPPDGGKLHSVSRVQKLGENKRLAITGWIKCA